MLTRRGKAGLITHVRRVPKRFAGIEARRHVFTALGTDRMDDARARAIEVERLQDLAWSARKAGHDGDAERFFDALRAVAESRGFAYVPADRLADAPLSEILRRVAAVGASGEADRADVSDAVLGAAPEPRLMVSGLLARVMELTADRMREHSPDQMRRWKAARVKAVGNFVGAVGDRQIGEISRSDVLAFRAWWWARVEAGKVKAATANKDFAHLGAMIGAVSELEGRGISNPFEGIRFADDTGKRVPFSVGWIRDHLLRAGALDGMNDQARDILLVMARLRTHNQNMTVAASAIADRNTFGHLS